MIFDKVFLKFIIAGIINTVIGAGVMFILYNIAGFGYWYSSAANYVIGGICSFFINKYWTFQIKKWSVFIVISFIASIAISYFIAYGVSKPAVSYLLKDSNIKFRENMALLTGMCLYTGINYLAQRFIVFKKNKPEGSES